MTYNCMMKYSLANVNLLIGAFAFIPSKTLLAKNPHVSSMDGTDIVNILRKIQTFISFIMMKVNSEIT